MSVPKDLSEWIEWARRDDWDCFHGPGHIRLMLGEIERLRAALTQFVSACETAPPTSLMIELGAACKTAKAALPPQETHGAVK